MATMLENYQQDYLIQESVDRVQIEVPGWPETEEQTNISISMRDVIIMKQNTILILI